MDRLLYRWTVGGLLVVAAWFGLHARLAGPHLALGPVGFNQRIFMAVMFGSIPGTVLLFLPLRLLLGTPGNRVFWIKNPARTVGHESADPAEDVLQKSRELLGKLGFTVEALESNDGQQRFLFRKEKADKVVRFIDHAFAGEVSARRESGRTQVATTVIFQDTVVLDSGEQERLTALARYLCGATAELKVAVLPFTLLCGAMIAIVNLGLCSVDGARVWLAPQQLNIALAAVGMILFGGYPILRNRTENHGLLLGLLGLAAAVWPLLAG